MKWDFLGTSLEFNIYKLEITMRYSVSVRSRAGPWCVYLEKHFKQGLSSKAER